MRSVHSFPTISPYQGREREKMTGIFPLHCTRITAPLIPSLKDNSRMSMEMKRRLDSIHEAEKRDERRRSKSLVSFFSLPLFYSSSSLPLWIEDVYAACVYPLYIGKRERGDERSKETTREMPYKRVLFPALGVHACVFKCFFPHQPTTYIQKEI